MGTIVSIINTIRELISLIRVLLDWRDKVKEADAVKNRQDREKAIDDQQKAKDEKEFDDAQNRIIDHKPH